MESYHLYLDPFHEQTLSISDDSPFRDHFYIKFSYIHQEIMPSQTYPLNPTYGSITTINRIFVVPREILCNCDEFTVLDRDNKIFWYVAKFNSLPVFPELLDTILPLIGECARDMVAQNQRNIWEMDVKLIVTTRPSENNNDAIDDEQCELMASQVVDSLEKVKVTDLAFYSTEQCAICLEEFCKDQSKSELVSTKCFHVFHRECVVQWLQNCIGESSSYTCPMCRRPICQNKT